MIRSRNTVSFKPLSRRHTLAAMGVAMALPALEVMCPRKVAGAAKATPRRFLAVCNNLGLLNDRLYPKETGRDYQPSPYMEPLLSHRKDITLISGSSHPEVDGGHPADICFLTAAAHPASGGFRNTISLDQVAARHIGHLTRFPTLTLGVNVNNAPRSLSWTPGGVVIPCEEKPSVLYRKLFLKGSPTEEAAQLRRLAMGRSVMDAVGAQAKSLEKGLPAVDRERMEQYYTSVRDLERRIAVSREWEDVPKPKVSVSEPRDADSPTEYFRRTHLMYAMARLAFETDSTRLITLMLDSVASPVVIVPGATIKDGYHSLSHHGKSEEKLAQLDAIDREHMKLLSDLFSGLKNVKEDGAPLLDRTMILYGSNLGDANTHSTTNLPILFTGGGFRHGQHLAFDRTRNYPLPNLFVNILQRLGVPAERFTGSTGTMTGIEPV
ncbi:MAG: DUF1552 domain-containing protein [Deltaproteobacteria bacterium]|nr:DUF1552 domain-containing protein [Deltaproteobacteria bacterium]